MVSFDRFTSIDYIAMGKIDIWELNKLAAMLTWFALDERSHLVDFMRAEIIVDEDGKGVFKDKESKAFFEIHDEVYKKLYNAYIGERIKIVERLKFKDLLDGKMVNYEYCVNKDSALEYLEECSVGIDVDKLKKLLTGELVTGREDNIIKTIVTAYGVEGDPSAAPKSMARQRHEASLSFKEGLKVRIDDYFSGGCRCTSKTAFEELKKQWRNEAEMKAEVKVGYYSLNELVKDALAVLEKDDPEKVVRRNQAKGYSKEKICTSCPKHRRTILK